MELNDFVKILESNIALNVQSMSAFQSEVLENFLQPLNPDVERSALNLILLSKFSQLVTLYRPQIEFEGTEVFVNFYGMLFMPSGSGKDRIHKHLNRGLMKPFYSKHAMLAENFAEMEMSKIEEIASEKFTAGKAQKESYVEMHSPRTILAEGGDGTLEGWYAQREVLSLAGFGATNFFHSEFGEIVSRRSEANKMLMVYLKDAYDGDTKAKVIKGDKLLTAVSGVPSNFFAHSPLKSILADESKEALIELLDSGIARRSLICIETKTPLPNNFPTSLEDSDRRIKNEAWQWAKGQSTYVEGLVASSNRQTPLRLDEGAELFLAQYRYWCDVRAFTDFDEIADEGKIAEIKGRFYKALKLAGILHLVDGGGDVISLDHMQKAVWQVEFYAKYIRSIYTATPPSAGIKVYNFLIQNLDKFHSKNEIIRGCGMSSKTWYAVEEDIIEYLERVNMDGDDYRITVSRLGARLSFRATKKGELAL
jgi:hypothetical protein